MYADLRRSRLTLLVTLASIAACENGPTAPGLAPPNQPDVRSFVEGAALASLDANGHFILPAPSVTWPYPMISAAAALELALGLLENNQFGGWVEATHGRAIDAANLTPHDRVMFAESHLEPLAPAVEAGSIRTFGPQYIIPFYSNDIPTLTIVVSVHATNLAVGPNGFVLDTTANIQGGGYHISGVPLFLTEGYPPLPEVAVQFAFEQIGVPIVEVPILGSPGHRIERTAARWSLRLARPATFERLVDGVVLQASEIFVGTVPLSIDALIDPSWTHPPFGLRLFVAADEQPTTDRFDGFRIRSGYTINLHEVRAVR